MKALISGICYSIISFTQPYTNMIIFNITISDAGMGSDSASGDFFSMASEFCWWRTSCFKERDKG
jgi:hypothetical protein